MKVRCATLALLFLSLRVEAEIAPHSFGIFADLSATQRSIEIPAFSLRNFYLIAVKVDPISFWEAALSFTPPGWSVIDRTLNPPNALNITGPDAFIVGLGGCYFEGPTYLLVSYTLGWFQSSPPPEDELVCLGGVSPSSFQGSPGYANCEGELIEAQLSPAVGTLPAGCLVFNPRTIVQSERRSWGAVKARYSQ